MFVTKTRSTSVSNLMLNTQGLARKSKYLQKDPLGLLQKQSPTLPKLKGSRNPTSEGIAPSLSDLKRIKKNQTQQLSVVINKYLLSRAQYLKKPYNDFSYSIMDIIKQFSLVENNFQELFCSIYQDLKVFLYLTTNAQFAAKYQIRQGEMYKKVCEDIDSKVNKKLKQSQQIIKKLSEQNEQYKLQLQRHIKQFSQKQKKYLKQIQYYKKIANNQYVKYIQQQISSLKDRIQQLEQSQYSLVKVRDEVQKELSIKTDLCQKQLVQIGKLKVIAYELRMGRQESQRRILVMRDRFDQLNLKMVGIKQVISTVQTENQNLKSERIMLSKRAAVSFQQLTPRPKYKKFFNFTQVEQKKTLKSTSQLSQIFIQKFGAEAYKKQFRQELFDQKLSSPQPMHPRLQQVENIREATLQSILQSKQQLVQVSRILSDKDDFS